MTTDYPNERQGAFAEEYVANSYDLEHVPNVSEWYDCVHPFTGTKYEVKSTEKRIGDDYPADGRFRLWEDQHRSLAGAEGAENQTAYYAFVLLDDGGDVVDVQRRHPSTVTRILDERTDDGSPWNQAGHTERDGAQYKLPYTEVFEL